MNLPVHVLQENYLKLDTLSKGRLLTAICRVVQFLSGFYVDDVNLKQFRINSSYSCGDDEERLISYYFSRGYSYEAIVKFLEKFHDIKMCVRTLKNRLSQYGLRRKTQSYDVNVVRERIRQELDGPGCMGGYRTMWHTLRLENIHIPRRDVAQLMRA